MLDELNSIRTANDSPALSRYTGSQNHGAIAEKPLNDTAAQQVDNIIEQVESEPATTRPKSEC